MHATPFVTLPSDMHMGTAGHQPLSAGRHHMKHLGTSASTAALQPPSPTIMHRSKPHLPA